MHLFTDNENTRAKPVEVTSNRTTYNPADIYLFKVYNRNARKRCLTSSTGKTHEEEIGAPYLGQTGQNQAQNWVFRHFLKFGSLGIL